MSLLFLREDDAGEALQQFTTFVDAARSAKLPFTYAAIPEQIDQETLRLLQNEEKRGCSVVQHGTRHKNWGNQRHKYEFGNGRSFSEQYQDLLLGKQKYVEVFGVASPIFVPPWHQFDSNTLLALDQLQFTGFSAQWDQNVDHPTLRVRHVDLIVEFDHPNYEQYEVSVLKKMYRGLLNKKTFGVLFHHNELHSENEIQRMHRMFASITRIVAATHSKVGTLHDAFTASL